jgi:hypothetical protein
MIGGRLLTVASSNVTVAAAQDLQGYLCASGKFAMVMGFWVEGTDQILPSACDLALALNLLTATVTPGTGGSAVGPQKWDPGDGTVTGSAWQNATTPATTTGTTTNKLPKGCHLFQGIDKLLPTPLPLLGGEAVVLSLLVAPAAASKLSSGLWIREFGG